MSSSHHWVNYRAVKAAVGIGQVLAAWRIPRLRPSGPGQYRGPCPLHGGHGVDAFHVNLRRHVFHCFACQAGGNVLDLVAALERCTVHQAACRLQEQFGVPARLAPATVVTPAEKLVTERSTCNSPCAALPGLDFEHPYLHQRGFDDAVAAHFGIGYWSGAGWLRGRIAIPVHNPAGKLVAYCGRAVPGLPGPRYRFPAGFAKSLELFNLHRAAATDSDDVIVVEGFFDCLRIHQAGYPTVVALMGSAMSRAQEQLLVQRFSRVTFMLDGDAAGRAAAPALVTRLRPRCAVREVILPPGCQPDGLSAGEIKRKLSSNG
jgi:DNA primase